MSTGVVFKQRYKSANLPSTPALNVKYLEYIATRKGAIYNTGYGFGLWGKLPSSTEAQDINDLKFAKQIVSTASKGHTLYRVILSVDQDTAAKHGLYYRSIWQDIISRKADVLAREMGIDRKDFCWAASMHYTKGHPHVHVMYWDNSAKVREEFVSPERFEIMAEHVRAAFGKEIYQEELLDLRAEAKAASEKARLELCAMCREANLIEALNLDHVSVAKLDELGQQFAKLALSMPDKGSLKYAYLSDNYKEKLNVFLDEVMNISDFSRLQARYLKLTDQISKLYGNGEATRSYNREHAVKELYTGLGNTVMKAMKEYRAELEAEVPEGVTELRVLMDPTVRRLLRTTPNYQVLAGLLPKNRTPLNALREIKGFQETKDAVVKELCRDLRVRTLMRRCAEERWAGPQPVGGPKDDAAREEKKEFEAAMRKELYRTVDSIVLSQLREDAGYDRQRDSGSMLMLLLRMFHATSQGANQMQSQRDLIRQHPQRELSETARMDRRKQMEQSGGWSL